MGHYSDLYDSDYEKMREIRKEDILKGLGKLKLRQYGSVYYLTPNFFDWFKNNYSFAKITPVGIRRHEGKIYEEWEVSGYNLYIRVLGGMV